MNDDGHAQRYIPSQNEWVATGTVPVALSGSESELGPAFLLPDGRAFYLGATSHTAFYTPSSNTWTAGPDIPDLLATDDVPGAMMPDGNIIFAADTPDYTGPTKIFDFNPIAGTYTNVTPSFLDMSGPAYVDRMLDLPSGQILFTNSSDQLGLFTPSGSPSPSWQPQVTQVTANGDGSFTLTGTQLNGISQGAAYGDDAEMDTNYPIVELINSSGNVYFARTYDWSSTGVATGANSVSTLFQPPADLPPGAYSLVVVANGIASAPISFSPKGLTTTIVTASPTSVTYGQPVTLTATVAASSDAYTPQGTVQFVVDGRNSGSAVTLSNGTVSVSDASLPAGSPTIIAIFTGTDGISISSSGTLADGLTIQRAPLTITAVDESKTYGQA